MKKFKVTAAYTVYCTAEVEAENKDQAFMIAVEMDGGSFEPDNGDGLGDWRIYDVTETE